MNTRYRKWQASLHEVIFESNTAKGKVFDIALLVFILLSVLVVVLDSVEELHTKYGRIFLILEWCLTILFTLEYFLRILCVRHPLRYAFGFLGIIDLLAILPMYLSIIMVGAQSLLVLRVLRLLLTVLVCWLCHVPTSGAAQ